VVSVGAFERVARDLRELWRLPLAVCPGGHFDDVCLTLEWFDELASNASSLNASS
jgi:hypothetical protein